MSTPVITHYVISDPSRVTVQFERGSYEYITYNRFKALSVVYMERRGFKKWLPLLKLISSEFKKLN